MPSSLSPQTVSLSTLKHDSFRTDGGLVHPCRRRLIRKLPFRPPKSRIATDPRATNQPLFAYKLSPRDTPTQTFLSVWHRTDEEVERKRLLFMPSTTSNIPQQRTLSPRPPSPKTFCGHSAEQEVCHRGFVAIAAKLVKAGADVAHIPDSEASCGAHIMRGAPQSALGEAARGGYKTVGCSFLWFRFTEQSISTGSLITCWAELV